MQVDGTDLGSLVDGVDVVLLQQVQNGFTYFHIIQIPVHL